MCSSLLEVMIKLILFYQFSICKIWNFTFKKRTEKEISFFSPFKLQIEKLVVFINFAVKKMTFLFIRVCLIHVSFSCEPNHNLFKMFQVNHWRGTQHYRQTFPSFFLNLFFLMLFESFYM